MNMKIVKRILLGLGGALLLIVLVVGGYVLWQVRAFDASMAREYPIPLPSVARSTAATELARGDHLVHSLGGCAAQECHGPDLAGGKVMAMGPVGTIAGPNITPAGVASVYSDPELARLIKHGVKKDGRSVQMMPVQDFYWLPESDVIAIVSYLRTVPGIDKPSGATRVGVLGKVLDRRGEFPWDIARRVAELPQEEPPAPEPTQAYGRFVVRLCTGCHGETLSGGPLPGAPPSIPTPLNITKHETGIAAYDYNDFVKVLKTGLRKNGQPLDPFMAIDLTRNLDDVELRALWAEISSRPPKPFGGR